MHLTLRQWALALNALGFIISTVGAFVAVSESLLGKERPAGLFGDWTPDRDFGERDVRANRIRNSLSFMMVIIGGGLQLTASVIQQ